MAYDDSEALQPNSTYSLGGYTFELKVQNVHEPGEPDVVSVFAICRSPDGTRQTVPMDFPSGTTVESWTVEANETEASVYVQIRKKGTNPFNLPPFTYTPDYTGTLVTWPSSNRYSVVDASIVGTSITQGVPYAVNCVVGSKTRGTAMQPYTYDGKTAYYYPISVDTIKTGIAPPVYSELSNYGKARIAWTMLYGDTSGKDVVENELVARFAIDIREADGGPDGDWDEPGDTGDPSYTLNVSVTGASSGSNSGIPLEAQEQSVYGSGGYGGNGGGGGAGASTVIIYEFATDKAGTVNQEATAQGPGTGGPGGKGGKGGDGCILIFY